ncbi:pleckstrin homology domain-containing family M member 3-like isoform X3 [Pomacea canaliculata]|uniref:pleckstrin homology domain-containing family M member 3-like isoform X3 n=1 Tax=Pomacea canaliculata TaxID=400727 RepID=UPI000D729E37|nr:pleckstrin homology domain-containing family M member 3-like isoform X3 [Pomacea canaliculata]
MDGWTSVPCPHEPDHNLEESYESMLHKYCDEQQVSKTMKVTVQDILDGLEPPPSPPVQKAESFLKVEEGSRVEQMKILSQPKGMQAQNFTCAQPDCMKGIGHFHGPGRLCDFDGKSYCNTCHENQTAYIPAEIVYNWDFKKKRVCKASYEFLQNNIDQPLLDVEEMYSGLYTKVVELNAVKVLRIKLTSLRSYMFTCSEATVRMLRDKVWPREHLYNKIHIYSVNDLVEVKSGRMQKFLQEVVDLCLAHVYSCGLCVLKGFICEICKDSKPIFPFETESTVKCQKCKAVYHMKCKRESVPCPKCLRLAKRGKKISDTLDEDYAYPHL